MLVGALTDWLSAGSVMRAMLLLKLIVVATMLRFLAMSVTFALIL